MDKVKRCIFTKRFVFSSTKVNFAVNKNIQKLFQMKIDKSTIEKLAHLSRLDFDAKDEEKMINSLNKILDWVDMLNKIDTTGVEPLTHMTEERTVLRQDEVGNILSHERALLNAPKKDSDYFRVPKVIE
jgi:aspartyl-tRNA(Asn)/glutamyl-tRNA(Gln) amidotransferase subunit C